MFNNNIKAILELGYSREILIKFSDNSINLILTHLPYADRRKHAYSGVSPEK